MASLLRLQAHGAPNYKEEGWRHQSMDFDRLWGGKDDTGSDLGRTGAESDDLGFLVSCSMIIGRESSAAREDMLQDY